jgi:hypothetical protein
VLHAVLADVFSSQGYISFIGIRTLCDQIRMGGGGESSAYRRRKRRAARGSIKLLRNMIEQGELEIQEQPEEQPRW